MLFSVIVANYNNGAYLSELINSVKRQTYSNWQLIIADDCSTDTSKEILKQYEGDEKIKILFHAMNMGAAATFKTAVEAANGELIGMLGADDALVPNAIETMVQLHKQNPQASLVCSNLFHCDENLNIIAEWDKYKQPSIQGSLINDISVGSFATFKKRMYLETKGFNPFFKSALDHDIYLKLEEVGEVLYSNKPLYLYRSNPIGISQNSNWLKAAQYSLLARMNAYKRRNKNAFTVNLSKEQYNEIEKKWFSREAKLLFAQKKYRKAAYCLLKASLFL